MPATKTPLPVAFALFLGAAVPVAALGGSAWNLFKIAATMQMDPAWLLPVCLDAAAFLSAFVIRQRRHWLGWVVLIVTVTVSTALQVAAAPNDMSARLVHGIPAPAAVVTFELALLCTPDRLPVTVSRKRTKPPATAPPPPAASTKTTPPARKTAPTAPRTPAPSVVELVPVALSACAHIDGPVSRDKIKVAMMEAGHPVTNNSKADDLKRLVNEARAQQAPGLRAVGG